MARPDARKAAAALAAAALLAGCAGPKPFVLNPKYAQSGSQPVHMFPLLQLEVANPDDYKDDLGKGGEAQAKPEDLLGRMFFTSLGNEVRQHAVEFDSLRADAAIMDTTLEIPGANGPEKIAFRIPDAAAAKAVGADSAWGLQLFRVRFSRHVAASQPFEANTLPAPKGPGGLPAAQPLKMTGKDWDKLELSGYFLLWDYAQHCPVAYGRIQTESRFTFAMTRSDWEKVIRDGSEQIAEYAALR